MVSLPEPDLEAGLNSVKSVCGTLYPFESHRRLYSTFYQNFDFKIRREHQKISYERRVYESVDVRSLFWVTSHRFTESRAWGLKGLYAS